MLKLTDIKDWTNEVLTKGSEIFFRRKIQPVVFVYPAQNVNNPTKITPGVDTNGHLQVDIAASSAAAAITGDVGTSLAPVEYDTCAGNTTLVVGAAGESWEAQVIYLEGAAGGARWLLVNAAAAGGSVTTTASAPSAMTGNIGYIPVQGDDTIGISGGQADGVIHVYSKRIA